MWASAAGWLLDRIYPASCVLCADALSCGRCLCDACDASLPRLKAPFCASCGEMFDGQIDGDFICPNCNDLTFAFEFARPALPRDDRTLEMVHRLKYGREVHLGCELGRLAAGALEDERFAPACAGKWPLVPVPLHGKRMRHRHFNQSAEIARAIGQQSGHPVLHALKRVRATETQTQLSRKQRIQNLKGAFEVTKRGIAAEKGGVILVDDVLTTGSTVHECARTLKRAGFQRVCVITVMRG